jgi:transcriptional regulator with XRE-family HTH domain
MVTPIPAEILDELTTFGELLRYLRRRAGLTQTELSIAVGYGDAQIKRCPGAPAAARGWRKS